MFKYIIIGDPAVGKSCLLFRFLNNSFSDEYDVTVGVEFGAKTITCSNKDNVKLQLWDTAGQESFYAVTRAYYKGAAVAVVVCDATDRATFISVTKWVEECRNNASSEVTLVLVVNKCDLASQRKVFRLEAEEYARQNKMIYVESSAKTGEGVEEIFEKSAETVLQKVLGGLLDVNNDDHGVQISAFRPSVLKRSSVVARSEKSGCCK